MSDEELVIRYREGKVELFNELYERYKNLVTYYTRKLYIIGAGFDDYIQEGMLGLIKAVNTYRYGESSFKTYASLCIKSSLLSAVKKFEGNKNSPLNESTKLEMIDNSGFFEWSAEDVFIAGEQGKEIKDKIYTSLSAFEKQVVNLFLSGLSYLEIAQKTNRNVKAVDNALTRAKKKITADLERK